VRAEVAVLLAAAGVLLAIGVFGYMITETEIVAGDPPDTPTVQMIQPYLPAGMTSLALGLIILVVAVVAAVAMRSR